MAFPPGPNTNNGDPFNPTDFTASCNPNVPPPPTLNLNNPTTAAAPVPKTCTETGGPQAVTVNWISDTLSGNATDNAWGQGDKSDCFLAKQGVPLMRVVDQENQVVALAEFASFALCWVRMLASIHLWSFRAPDKAPKRERKLLPGPIRGVAAPRWVPWVRRRDG